MASEVRLWIFVQEWVVFFSIPVREIPEFTVSPHKWFHFLCGTIYGQAGSLHVSPDNGQLVDYAVQDLNQLYEDYYFSSMEQPRWLDPDLLNNKRSLCEIPPKRSQAPFRTRLIARDSQCVATGCSEQISQAAHLIPKSKGDKFIRSFTALRGEQEDLIESIDDPRNGLLLTLILHEWLDRSDIAVIKTPNFAMAPEDVPSSDRIPTGRRPTKFHCPSRWTLQHFTPDVVKDMGRSTLPLYIDLEVPRETDDWPTDLILNSIYCVAAIKRWGNEGSIAAIRDIIQPQYYPQAPNIVNERHRISEDQKIEHAKRAERRAMQNMPSA
ncbi:hypothetical protein CPB86DRAFT_878393 [Serendipita vermifera]|nr:hypothetical protein CPB86DRAFT_878393 [Serendipita vermifera]